MIPTPTRPPLLAAAAGAVALLAATACAASAAPERLRELSVDDVAAKLGQPGFHVFDANGPEKFAEVHVPGARHVHYRKFTEAELPSDRGAALVFYCANPG